jgi:hypothetical protein
MNRLVSLSIGRTSTLLRRFASLVVGAIALSGAPLVAHDLWIQPTTFSPEPGAIVGARLRIGQDLVGDPLPRDPALINQFVVEDGEGRRPLIGRNGADPAGLLRVAAPGLLVIGYRSNPSTVELTAEKFNQYLKEEGLDAVVALRARRGQTGGARELFSRCAKSLVLSGSANSTQGDRSLGFTLELVAERNPYAMRVGQELPVRLTYEGQPLAGALVVAMNHADPSDKLTARSDNDGRVRFRMPRPGMWMIKAVHMIPAQPASHADWESFWASLTFDFPGAINAPRLSTR